MINYYFWHSPDENLKLARVSDWENDDDFDVRAGVPTTESIPDNVFLLLDPGELPDRMANTLSWVIVSERFLEVMNPFLEGTCEVIRNVPLRSANSGKPVENYAILNPLQVVRMSYSESNSVPYSKMRVAAKLVPESLHIFAPQESSVTLVVSEKFVRLAKEHKLIGMEFTYIKAESQ